MSIPEKIEILDIFLDKQTSLIYMKVRFVDKDITRQFCWMPDDLKNALNIKGEITEELWEGFFSQIKGKQINMVCEVVGDPEAPFITNSQMFSHLEKAKENMSKYDNLFD